MIDMSTVMVVVMVSSEFYKLTELYRLNRYSFLACQSYFNKVVESLSVNFSS